MKRTLIASALIALSTVVLPGHALTGNEITSGTIIVPVGMSRAQRCAYDQGQPNGYFGWVVTVTAGKGFTLTTPDPTMDDVNIGFYKTLTPCQENANIAGSYVNDFGNESGLVPATATKAIIYTASIPIPPESVGYARPNTPFTYTQFALT